MEAVLSGSEAAFPGLIEIPKSPQWETLLLTKANTMNSLEGNRLQPGDALDVSHLHVLDTSRMRVPRVDLTDELNKANRAKRASNEVLPNLLY